MAVINATVSMCRHGNMGFLLNDSGLTSMVVSYCNGADSYIGSMEVYNLVRLAEGEALTEIPCLSLL